MARIPQLARTRPSGRKEVVRKITVNVDIDVAKLVGKIAIAALVLYALVSGDGLRVIALLLSNL